MAQQLGIPMSSQDLAAAMTEMDKDSSGEVDLVRANANAHALTCHQYRQTTRHAMPRHATPRHAMPCLVLQVHAQCDVCVPVRVLVTWLLRLYSLALRTCQYSSVLSLWVCCGLQAEFSKWYRGLSVPPADGQPGGMSKIQLLKLKAILGPPLPSAEHPSTASLCPCLSVPASLLGWPTTSI